MLQYATNKLTLSIASSTSLTSCQVSSRERSTIVRYPARSCYSQLKCADFYTSNNIQIVIFHVQDFHITSNFVNILLHIFSSHLQYIRLIGQLLLEIQTFTFVPILLRQSLVLYRFVCRIAESTNQKSTGSMPYKHWPVVISCNGSICPNCDHTRNFVGTTFLLGHSWLRLDVTIISLNPSLKIIPLNPF